MPLLGEPGSWMTFRTTNYREADGSPEASYSPASGQIHRRYFIGWEDRFQAAIDFTGDVEVVTQTGHNFISRTTPHPFPGRPWMHATNVSAEKSVAIRGTTGNLGDGTGVANYLMADFHVTYVYPPFLVKEDNDPLLVATSGDLSGFTDEGFALASGWKNSRFVSKVVKREARILAWMGAGLLLAGPNKPIMEAQPINQFVGEVAYKWYQVPEEALPEGTWIAGANTVNDETFDGWPPGTLLFGGNPDVEPRFNPMTGKRLYEVTYKFATFILPDRSGDTTVFRGHNYIRFRDVATKKIKATKTSSDGTGADPGTVPFPDFDFRKFFQPPPP